MKRFFLKFNILIVILLSLISIMTTRTGHCAEPTRIDPDYSKSESWLSLPASIDKDVDVFWIYPTVYTGKNHIAAIDEPQMVAGAKLTLITQAAVFGNSANIFAPFYRQANISVLGLDDLHKDQFLNVGKYDVRAAFNHYLRELNNGRPFIIAGHSQGSVIALTLIKELMSDPALRSKMIAAYTIGWSVTQADLDNYTFLKICETPDQTGCIITYNTVAEGYQKNAPTILTGSIGVNPLSWTTTSEKVPTSQNKGAVFFNMKGEVTATIPEYCSAQNIDGGIVVETKNPELMKQLPFDEGVYHIYDYSLFFENLKANAAERIKSYQSTR
ncbi:MAG: hypothetical protein BA863_04175 [Desulfovibrio sp. S3730MH75]|nr:MAG: hypothetical protein BA863_04175 [Desulfovibrio sp. S3730MH75]